MKREELNPLMAEAVAAVRATMEVRYGRPVSQAAGGVLALRSIAGELGYQYNDPTAADALADAASTIIALLPEKDYSRLMKAVNDLDTSVRAAIEGLETSGAAAESVVFTIRTKEAP